MPFEVGRNTDKFVQRKKHLRLKTITDKDIDGYSMLQVLNSIFDQN